MKNYEIFKINEYESYLLLLSNEDIYYLYDEIRTKSNGEKILVDMFFRNGFSFNRFIELIFDDNNQVTTRVINPRYVSEPIKENTHEYFKNNREYLEKSTLSKSIKAFVYSN